MIYGVIIQSLYMPRHLTMMGTSASKSYQHSLNKIVPNLDNEWLVVLITDVNRKQHDKITCQQYRMPHRY